MSTNTRTSRRRGFKGETLAPYLFVSLAAIYLLLFTAIPIVRGLLFSFTDSTLLNPTGGAFIGFDNYASVLTGAEFYSSLAITIIYSAGTVVGSLTLGTIAALAINEKIPGRALYRALLTMPWAAPSVAVVLVFLWIFNLGSGVANRGVTALGISEQGWLLDPQLGLITVTAVSVWKVFPFVMLVVLAALQSVPSELREAARVDGADRLSVFRSVTLPHISPTLRVIALLMTIWSIRRFEIVYLLTGGGPIDSTNTIVISVYREAFQNSDLGRASAIGLLGLLLSLVVTVIYYFLDSGDRRRSER